MNRRDATDLSFDELVQGLLRLLHSRLCSACGARAGELVSELEQFPLPEYRDDRGVPFWKADTVRGWVQAYAWAELLSIPGEVERLTELTQRVRTLQGAERLSPAAAKEWTLHSWADVMTKRVMGPSRAPGADDGKAAPGMGGA